MLLEVTMSAHNIWECILLVFGGLGVFLYGINLMGDALKDLAGAKLKMIIEKSTNTPLKGILVGAGLTAIIQSSSGTTALVVGLVRSGLMTLAQAVIIGFVQALALIPGTSRSGITLTAGLFLGMRPESAARFSFLLSIPVILASGLLEGIKIVQYPELNAAPLEIFVGVFISFITALIVIHCFLKFISKSGMAVFVIYRLLLGSLLLYLIH